ncbi:TetR/AcrR family transcriptional regulator [Pleomorphovibrio marinus]|uniref:TetR/AcrR family transcriptional regulator n=1 Tax=Pleomorphovibrio marinus TaxID=2164132 RepID=UPI000E0C53E0|nr:TetR/AcrR family transcriptional regulator [Pleomorphovibrio marinus]
MEKEKFAQEALNVFNRFGYAKTDMEKLVQGINIGQGELEEHFSGKSDLVIYLFQVCCKESDEVSAKIDKEESTLGSLLQVTRLSFRIQVKYRFIFLDFYQIIESLEEIRDRYYELLSLRKTQLIHLFQLLEQEGLFRGEIIQGQYSNLANQMTMLSDYWVTNNFLFFGKEDFKPEYYSHLVFSILLPYLTEKGLKQYKDVTGL